VLDAGESVQREPGREILVSGKAYSAGGPLRQLTTGMRPWGRDLLMRNPEGFARLWGPLRRRVVRAARAAYAGIERSPVAPLLQVPPVQRLKDRIASTPASRVHSLLDLLSAAGVHAWVGGGWGVDALVGRQTRRHYDLDLVISDARDDYLKVADVLKGAGFRPADAEFNPGLPMPWRYVWQHDDGHSVEVLPVALHDPPFSAGLQDSQSSGTKSPFAHGTIGGRSVRCLSAELQLVLHVGYPLRDVDASDMSVLRAHLNRAGGTAWT
jgi:lincosamide nucleotidyltransferase A/C/D/E